MILSKITHLTSEVLDLLPIEDYETKRFFIRNNLIGLPLYSIFNKSSYNIDEISELSRKLSGKEWHLYNSVNQNIIIPKSKFKINERGLITNLIEYGNSQISEFLYDQYDRKVYQRVGLNYFYTSFYHYNDDGSAIVSIFDNESSIRILPEKIRELSKHGFLKQVIDIKEIKNSFDKKIHQKLVGSKYDEYCSIIESRNYIYKNIYRTDAADLLDHVLVYPKDKTDPRYMISYEYDEVGNWISRTTTNLLKVINEPTIQSRKINYKNGRLSSIINPTSNAVLYTVMD